jgi:alcohol dehydrogenase (cytochrome c)
VPKLVPVWAHSFGGEKQRGQESRPVIYKGKMFVTASYSRLFALDASTGKKLWRYEHRLPEGIMPCCDVVNRGAALYDSLVILATLDAQLGALDQNTGEVVWKEKIDDYAAGYSATAAPNIANGLILTGVSGGEFGVVGRVELRDAKTGQLVWSRPTVEGHMGYTYDQDGNKKEARRAALMAVRRAGKCVALSVVHAPRDHLSRQCSHACRSICPRCRQRLSSGIT